MSTTSPRVAVVIPFFQVQSGVLRRAVASALEQECDGDFEIIVIDDASPCSAESEIRDFMDAHPAKIRVFRNAVNAKQGAARNRALDALSPDTEYVALLDSDDEWTGNHLGNAVAALDRGYDFYFADHYQLHQKVSAFNRNDAIDVEEHPLVAGTDGLREFRGDMFGQIIHRNVLSVSTTVYRARKFPDLRFPTEYTITGEEYMFWLGLAKRTNRIVFSTKSDCRYGEGVNVYSGTRWEHPRILEKIYDEIRFRKVVASRFELTTLQKRDLLRRVRSLRDDCVRVVLHAALGRSRVDRHHLLKILATDPVLAFEFLPRSISIAMSRYRGHTG